MKSRIGLLMLIAAMAAVVGCGGAGSNQSSQLTFDMEMLQVDGEPLIYGTVFNDLNDNSEMNTGEPGVAGVTVNLMAGLNTVQVATTTTNSGGMYAFAVSVGSDYIVEEMVPAGYYTTTPDIVPVSVSDTDSQVDFGVGMVPVEVPVDVKPGSDINPLNLRSKGVLPVAILGAEDFDVTMIDPSTLLLNGVPPLRWSYGDVCGSDDPCVDGSGGEVPDGFEDLTLKFSTQEIAGTLGDVQRGDIVTLVMDGYLSDGTPISGHETVWIVQVPK